MSTTTLATTIDTRRRREDTSCGFNGCTRKRGTLCGGEEKRCQRHCFDRNCRQHARQREAQLRIDGRRTGRGLDNIDDRLDRLDNLSERHGPNTPPTRQVINLDVNHPDMRTDQRGNTNRGNPNNNVVPVPSNNNTPVTQMRAIIPPPVELRIPEEVREGTIPTSQVPSLMRFDQTMENRHTGYDASIRAQIIRSGDTIIEPERRNHQVQPMRTDTTVVDDISEQVVLTTTTSTSTQPNNQTTRLLSTRPFIYCPVCLENHEVPDVIMWSQCGHFACDECKSKLTKIYRYYDWFGCPFVGPGAVCPICIRISFSFTKLHPEFRTD